VFGYLMLPAMLWQTSILTGVVLGYIVSIVTSAVMTILALAINRDLRYWRLCLALPFASIYQVIFNWLPGTVGVVSDILLFGNRTGFAPEWTLKKGRSVRLALLFRIRRALALTVRALVVGDVPLGWFWLGWDETHWTPSGFDGWSSGKRRAIVPPVRQWFRRRSPHLDEQQ